MRSEPEELFSEIVCGVRKSEALLLDSAGCPWSAGCAAARLRVDGGVGGGGVGGMLL